MSSVLNVEPKGAGGRRERVSCFCHDMPRARCKNCRLDLVPSMYVVVPAGSFSLFFCDHGRLKDGGGVLFCCSPSDRLAILTTQSDVLVV